jgi:hypothetical protein
MERKDNIRNIRCFWNDLKHLKLMFYNVSLGYTTRTERAVQPGATSELKPQLRTGLCWLVGPIAHLKDYDKYNLLNFIWQKKTEVGYLPPAPVLFYSSLVPFELPWH